MLSCQALPLVHRDLHTSLPPLHIPVRYMCLEEHHGTDTKEQSSTSLPTRWQDNPVPLRKPKRSTIPAHASKTLPGGCFSSSRPGLCRSLCDRESKALPHRYSLARLAYPYPQRTAAENTYSCGRCLPDSHTVSHTQCDLCMGRLRRLHSQRDIKTLPNPASGLSFSTHCWPPQDLPYRYSWLEETK